MPHFPFEQRHVRRTERARTGTRGAFVYALIGGVILIGCGTRLNAAGDRPAAEIGAAPFPAAAVEYFESKVRPILVDQCIKCHGPKKQSSGLRLDNREALLKGGESGPAIILAKPDESPLVQAVAHTHAELKMPPSGKLSAPEVAILRQWVALGAPWAASSGKAVGGGGESTSGTAVAATHWAFQPVRRPTAPAVNKREWIHTPVDAFVLARLEAAGLTPSPEADKRTLIRRATLDLWGIPPNADEVDAFVNDKSSDAFERLVDRLLASPRYGERWGRHWLDVARYADTKGYVFTQDRRYPYAYTYRDYVINALNADLGYNQFLVEQIAADQLAPGNDKRTLAALGFLTVGRRFLLDQHEIIDDRIDVVSRGLLGLTVTCARCHDHKFDPIPTEDYYSFYGVFASSVEPAELPLLGRPGDPTQAADYQRKLAACTEARDRYLASRRDEFMEDLQDRLSEYLKAAHELAFDPGHAKLEERGLADKLNTRRLRSMITMWRRYLDASSKVTDPVAGPWHAFAALPADQFAAKAAEIHRKLITAKNGKTPAIHPLVAQMVLATPPASMDEVVTRYTSLFGQLATRLKEKGPKPPGSVALNDPAWESLRQALFGVSGSLHVSPDAMREFLDQEQAGQLDQLNGAIVDLESTHRGCAGACDGDQRCTPAGRPARLHPRQPRAARRCRTPTVSQATRRARSPPVSKRERPTRDGPGHHRPQEPADRARNDQPPLAVALREAARHHAQRLRTAERSPKPSRSPRLPGQRFHGQWLVAQDVASANHALERISPAQRGPGRRDADRPRKPLGLAIQPPAPRFRVNARLASGRRRRSRYDDRRPRRRDQRAAVLDAPYGLRLHRSSESRRPVPHFRLRSARRHQPPTIRDHRAATGPVPYE